MSELHHHFNVILHCLRKRKVEKGLRQCIVRTSVRIIYENLDKYKRICTCDEKYQVCVCDSINPEMAK